MNLFPSDSTFCTDIETEQTGGGVMVDYMRMKNGKIIGITDECICVSNNMGCSDNGVHIGVIFLNEVDRWDEDIEPKDI